MKTLYLVRHGKASLDGDDLNRGLTPEGQDQANQLVLVLSKQQPQPSVVYSSPYQRAILSIKPYADSIGAKIKTHMDLREKKIATEPVDDIVAVRKQMYTDMNYRHSGGETGVEVQTRGMNIINHIIEEINDGESILVASHGNFIGHVIKFFQPSFGYDDWKNMSMPDLFRIDYSDDHKGVVKHIGVEGISTFKVK